ncbi:hypothetical protein Hanom_Chr03g00220181 [Helianthus anomalus]
MRKMESDFVFSMARVMLWRRWCYGSGGALVKWSIRSWREMYLGVCTFSVFIGISCLFFKFIYLSVKRHNCHDVIIT